MEQLHGAGEALVTLRVVILQADLQLHGLQELAWLLLVASTRSL